MAGRPLRRARRNSGADPRLLRALRSLQPCVEQMQRHILAVNELTEIRLRHPETLPPRALAQLKDFQAELESIYLKVAPFERVVEDVKATVAAEHMAHGLLIERFNAEEEEG